MQQKTSGFIDTINRTGHLAPVDRRSLNRIRRYARDIIIKSMLSSPSAKLPPENYRRIIQEMLVVLSDPVDKLNLLNRILVDYRRIPSSYRLYPRWAEIALRKMVLEEAEKIQPGSRKKAQQLIKGGVISIPRPFLWKVYNFRHVIVSTLVLMFVWGMGSAVAALFDVIEPQTVLNATLAGPARKKSAPRQSHGGNNLNVVVKTGTSSVARKLKGPEISTNLLLQEKKEFCSIPSDFPTTLEHREIFETLSKSTNSSPTLSKTQTGSLSQQKAGKSVQLIGKPLKVDAIPEYLEKPIWLVEKTGETETFSNRLHIITTHTVDNIPRKYLHFPRSSAKAENTIKTADQISGIIFHASESDLFPFNQKMNTSIKKHTAALIRYLKRNKSYHYFIDRFGRVYRIVREDHAAFHAGRSIWADDQWYYLNLNHAFIGICFEGRDFETINPDPSTGGTGSGGPLMVPMANTSISDAQLRSGKELTDWLRVKYRIRQHNCVPHGLVSINHKRKLIGHHLDLSHSFPFQRFGLSDKYQTVLPSIVDFGFTFDSFFEQVFKGKPWPGVQNSMAVLRQQAKRKKINFGAYQKSLQEKFDSYYAMEKSLEAQKETFPKTPPKPAYSKTARKK